MAGPEKRSAMIFRHLVHSLVVILGALPALGCTRAPCEGSNVVLVVVDTLRADHLTPYGYTEGSTPELKRFASKGVVFENVVSQASFTMASMGTMFTSTYPHHHGAGRHPSLLVADNKTMAEAFQAQGYRTAAFVCNPLLEEGSGFEQGFQEYFPLDEKETQGARGLIDGAITWLGTKGEGPFFLWLHLLDPHFPYLVRPGFVDPTKNRDARREYLQLVKRRGAGEIATGEIFFDCPLSPEAVRQAIRAYDSEINYTDLHFGRLLAALKELGLDEKTLVVFTSDHGESLGEHGLHFCHGFSVYDEALKVPWVMRIPGQAQGPRRVKETVRLLDLMPTVLSLTGIDMPDECLGQDLSPLLRSKEESRSAFSGGRPSFSESEPLYRDKGVRRYPQRKEIHVEGDEGKWKSVRLGQYKLIMIPNDPKPRVALYDLLVDPKETRNIFEEKPEEASRLLEVLEAWLADPLRRASITTPELDEEWARRLQSIGYIR